LNAPRTGTPLLLKSPSHTFRIPLLRHIFPRAKFIWVGRHTGEMLASNVRMWNAMFASHGLWTCPEGILGTFLDDMLRASAAVLTRCLDDIPRETLLWVDFQELLTSPTQMLQRVLEFLGLGGSKDEDLSVQRVEQALARIPIHQGSRSSLPMQANAQKVEVLMSAARGRFA
jgi:hypothetical protein